MVLDFYSIREVIYARRYPSIVVKGKAMIHSTLSFLSNELNEYLKIKSNDLDTIRILMSNVAIGTGTGTEIGIPDNHLGMSLINIEEERVFKEQRASITNNEGLIEKRNPEIKLNLYILISANYQDSVASELSTDYLEGLKQLSYVISFFQAKNVFTKDNSPALSNLDSPLEKLVVELYSYNFEQLNNFWSVLGTHYMPSVLYKVRVITVQEDEFFDSSAPIEKIGIDSKTKENEH